MLSSRTHNGVLNLTVSSNIYILASEYTTGLNLASACHVFIWQNRKAIFFKKKKKKKATQKSCQWPLSLCHEIFLKQRPTACSSETRPYREREGLSSFGGEPVSILSPELSGDALPASKRGLVFTAVTVVTTVPHGITVRSFSILAAGTGGGVCQDFASVGST